MKTLSMTVGGLFLFSVAAMAQTTPSASAQQPQANGNGTSLRQEMTDNLKQAGFTDVHVAPDSFFVQAKDKSGNPVAMLVGPNSVTELVDAMPQNGAARTGAHANGAMQNGSPFVANAQSDLLGSKLIGTDVRNSTNQDVGTIKDLAMKNGLVQAYVVNVGGFLGMGDHYVAVAPEALTISYDAKAKAVHATMNTTQAELRSAPAFQYANG